MPLTTREVDSVEPPVEKEEVDPTRTLPFSLVTWVSELRSGLFVNSLVMTSLLYVLLWVRMAGLEALPMLNLVPPSLPLPSKVSSMVSNLMAELSD